jgi:hypothetical protein
LPQRLFPSRSLSFAAIAFCIAGGCASLSHAVPVRDQSVTEPFNATAFINEGFPLVAQIYTAGVSGTLAAVNVNVTSNAGFPLRVSVRSVVDGLPTTTVLGEVLLSEGSAPLSLAVRFGDSIAQIAGEQYALVVDYPTQPSPAGLVNFWSGASDDVYAGGVAAASVDGVNWIVENASVDLHFRTFVNPVPAPDVLHLLALGGLCAALGLRRAKRGVV